MKSSAKKCSQEKDWYSLKDIAMLFGRSTRYARSLMTKGMPYMNLGGILRIPRKAFWDWLNVEDPGDFKPALISIKEMTTMFETSLAAGYRFKDELPKTVLVHVGGLWYVHVKQLYEWLSEQSKENARKCLEEHKNEEDKKQNGSRRAVSKR